MIAIEVSMVPTRDHTEVADIGLYQINCVNDNFQDVFSFFESCVDENIILNVMLDSIMDTTTYYAVSMENAQIFENKFQDLSADFSMRKFWNQAGFDTILNMETIEFDITEDPSDPTVLRGLGTVIDKELRTIWGIDFPASFA